jgi:hypothetical protein
MVLKAPGYTYVELRQGIAASYSRIIYCRFVDVTEIDSEQSWLARKLLLAFPPSCCIFNRRYKYVHEIAENLASNAQHQINADHIDAKHLNFNEGGSRTRTRSNDK